MAVAFAAAQRHELERYTRCKECSQLHGRAIARPPVLAEPLRCPSARKDFSERSAVYVVAGSEITMIGVLWYVAAIFIWWLIGCYFVGGEGGTYGFQDFLFGMGVAVLWTLPWWLPYSTWIAFGEL